MHSNTDLEIWKALKSGDKKALEQVYQDHVTFLYNYGRKMTSATEIIEDTIQELFIVIWSKRTTISLVDNIRAYLTVSFRRSLIKNLKSRQSSSAIAEDNTFEPERSKEEELIEKDTNLLLRDKLAQGMKHLSPREREIVALKYYAALSYEDIAETMDISYQSARNLLSRAISKLGKFVKFLIFWIFYTLS